MAMDTGERGVISLVGAYIAEQKKRARKRKRRK